jgi:pyridoxine 4-dehydrogenase
MTTAAFATTAANSTHRALCAWNAGAAESDATRSGRREVLMGAAAVTVMMPTGANARAAGYRRDTGGLKDIGEMGLGCWSWGNTFLWEYEESMDPELERVFDRAVDAGVRLFDTADSYGTGSGFDGRSEVLLGKFLKACPSAKRDDVILATKLAPFPWRVTANSFVDAAKESAGRLQVDSIALGQLHWSTGNYQPLQEGALWAGIADAYDQGIINAVGLSNYGPKQLRKIHKYMSKRGVPISTLQVQYSLLSRFPELNGTKETCDELGIKLIAYSPLALGLLTGKYSVENPPPGLRGFAYKDVLPPLPTLLETMREVGEAHGGKTNAQVALNWCMCKDTVPIPGAKNLKQLDDNLGALGWRLSASEIEELDRAAERVGKSVSQNVFQTA